MVRDEHTQASSTDPQFAEVMSALEVSDAQRGKANSILADVASFVQSAITRTQSNPRLRPETSSDTSAVLKPGRFGDGKSHSANWGDGSGYRVGLATMLLEP